MPAKTLYLDTAQTQPIRLEWDMFYKNFTATYESLALTPEPNGMVSKGGIRYVLPDGRVLSVAIKSKFANQEMEVLLDEKVLPGSATHPLERIKKAWYALLFVGILGIGAGLAAELMGYTMLHDLGLGWSSAVEGLVFLGLGWWGYSRRSSLAFYLALGLYVAEWVFSLVTLAQAGGKGGTGGIFVRLFISFLLFRGAQAAKVLRREAETPAF